MKVYAVYTRFFGDKDGMESETDVVEATTAKEAIKLARKRASIEETVTKVRLLGKANPEWDPEEALTSAIFGKPYEVPRWVK